MQQIKIFLSCVSDEFHREDPARDPNFFSWRTYLEHELNDVDAGEFVVLTQENALGSAHGDMLQILEDVVRDSKLIIHLYGDLRGQVPEAISLRRLHERVPNLLNNDPEIKQALPPWETISFSQWELYFAFHYHRTQPLIFLARDEAPRSPFVADRAAADRASKESHLAVIRSSGQRIVDVRNQDHLCHLVQTWLIKHGAFEARGLQSSPVLELTRARERAGELVQAMASALGIARGKVIGTRTRVTGRQILAAAESVAADAGIAPRDLVKIVEGHYDEQLARVTVAPTLDGWYELAFTAMALSDYPQAGDFARRARDLALSQRGGADDDVHRENALNAVLLLHETARMMHDIPTAMSALREGSGLYDVNRDPLAWADYHLMLATFARSIGYHQEAFRWLWGAEGADADADQPCIMDIYEDAYGKEEDELETEVKLAEALYECGRAQMNRGHDKAAIPLLQRAGRIYARQTPMRADNLGWCLLHESACHRNLAQHREGEASAREALQIFETLARQDPTDPFVAEGISAATFYLGEIHMRRGDLAAAKELFDRSVRIYEELLAAAPSDLRRGNLAVALDRAGVVRRKQGDLPGALELSQRSLDIHESLSTGDPANLAYQASLAGCLNEMGEIREAQGELDGALGLFQRSLKIYESLGAGDPANLNYQDRLVGCLHGMGQVRAAQGELDGALGLFQRSLDILESLSAGDPANLAYQRELSTSLEMVGVIREAQGDLGGALAVFQRSLEIRESLSASDPSHVVYQRDLSYVRERIESVREALRERG